jgi:hypothetical protein
VKLGIWSIVPLILKDLGIANVHKLFLSSGLVCNSRLGINSKNLVSFARAINSNNLKVIDS